MVEHIRDTEPKARKEKICYLCGIKIEKGTKHTVRTCVDDGIIISTPMHNCCVSMADYHYDDWDWECHDSLDFREKYLD